MQDIFGIAIKWSFYYFERLICRTVRKSRGFLDQVTYLTLILVAFTRFPFLNWH